MRPKQPASDDGMKRATVSGIVGSIEVCWSTAGIASIRFLHEAIEPDGGAATPLLEKLKAYLFGERVDFKDEPLRLTDCTPFQRKVLEACRQIQYGETTSYAGLARLVGQPGAARAVGGVMRRNPVPIIIPCHRVLSSGGGLGGFSAPGGVSLKERLLAMEQSHAISRREKKLDRQTLGTLPTPQSNRSKQHHG